MLLLHRGGQPLQLLKADEHDDVPCTEAHKRWHEPVVVVMVVMEVVMMVVVVVECSGEEGMGREREKKVHWISQVISVAVVTGYIDAHTNCGKRK